MLMNFGYALYPERSISPYRAIPDQIFSTGFLKMAGVFVDTHEESCIGTPIAQVEGARRQRGAVMIITGEISNVHMECE